MLKSVTHMQAASDVRWRNHDAVGFAAVIGVSFKKFVFFPILLPLGFSAFGVVLACQCRNRCGHAENTKSGRVYLNFAIGRGEAWLRRNVGWKKPTTNQLTSFILAPTNPSVG